MYLYIRMCINLYIYICVCIYIYVCRFMSYVFVYRCDIVMNLEDSIAVFSRTHIDASICSWLHVEI